MQFTSDQVKEVSSWIHDERKCVSIGAIQANLGLTRSQAQAVLRQVPDVGTRTSTSNNSYQVTKCVVSEEEQEEGGEEEAVKCTVFKLQTEKFDATQQNEKQFLYALALMENDNNNNAEATETLLTAHERDMAQLRDKMADNSLTEILSSSIDLIAPADPIRAQMDAAAAEALPEEDDDDEHVAASAKLKAVVPTFSKGPPKKTSAASFFNAKQTTTKTAAAAAATRTSDKSKNTATGSIKSTGAKKAPTDSTTTAAFKMKTPSEEKENLASEKKKVGNADDFVGDLEDSDDDDEPMQVEIEEQKAPAKKPRSKKKQAPSKQAVQNKEEEEEEEEEAEPMDVDEPVTGGMDAFATQKKKQPVDDHNNTKRKRRRKKLVEKSTMDASGYLHTETQEIWEDIPSDEDEKESSIVSQKLAHRPTAPAKTKGTTGKSGMKQGSLMGFFSKK